jgi:hypothetical protein
MLYARIAGRIYVHGSPAANEGANPLLVLDEGFQSAFLACVVLAGIGVALALLLLGRPREAPQEHPEPAAATTLEG